MIIITMENVVCDILIGCTENIIYNLNLHFAPQEERNLRERIETW